MPTISQLISTGEPYIRSYTQENIIPNILGNNCTGFIQDVTLSGGTPPYTIFWEGPSPIGVYTANTLNISNLCEGVYSGTVTDSLFSAHTSFIPITLQPIPALSVSLIDSGCTTNINGYCTLKVDSFSHDQAQFTYHLYQDGALYDSYIGFSGEEEHIFSQLSPGNYTVTAYDGINVDSTYLNSNGRCSDGTELNAAEWGEAGAANVLTGWSSTNILTECQKCIKFDASTIQFPQTYGPNATAVGYSGLGFTIGYDSGLKPDGSIEADNPLVWFYTGTTASRLTDNNHDWYLGTFDYPDGEGINVGPAVLGAVTDIGKFYYSTTLQKFIINYRTNAAINSWTTYCPTVDYGVNGNPVAQRDMTGATNYNIAAVETQPFADYTVTDDTGVMAWSDVAANVFLMGQNANTAYMSLTECGYSNYSWETTIGDYPSSVFSDNDAMGLVLGAFRDELGVYGPVNHTHTLSFLLNNNSSVSSVYLNNNFGDASHGFVDSVGFRYCGNRADACTGNYSGYSSNITVRPTAYSPYTTAPPVVGSGFGNQGCVRLRVDRTGHYGEHFRIQMTDVMDAADLSLPNPYNPTYEVNLNLLNKLTWTGETRQAPATAQNNDMVKFLGGLRVGFMQSSQRARFTHITFTGTQATNLTTEGGYGASASQLFSLYNPDLFGIEMSRSVGRDYQKSLSSGGRIGKPTVPLATPTVKASMETIIAPTVIMLSGGTKLNVNVDDYVILDPAAYNGDKLLELTFKWDSHVTNMLNENTYPYYSIHAFDNANSKFEDTPIITRMITNPLTHTYSVGEDGQVNGDAFEYTDKVLFTPKDNSWEYLIKTNYGEREKLKDLESTAANPILYPVECPVVPRLQTWLDTSNYTTTYPYNVIGNYDSKSDFVFGVLPTLSLMTFNTGQLDYGDPQECGTLTKQEQLVASASGMTSGSTQMPLLVEGQPYVVILDFPPAGDVVVTLNGLTLWEGEDLYDVDYYIDGSVVTFPADILAENDLLNFVYVRGDSTQSYQSVREIVPATVPTLTGTTEIFNTLYTNGYYYFINLSPTPIGAIGVVLNGIDVSGDMQRLAPNRLKFATLIYPTLQENDLLVFFYFTAITLLGVATAKYPTVTVGVNAVPFLTTTLTLIINDMMGNVVQQTTKEVVIDSGSKTANVQLEEDDVELVANTTFTVYVPAPGHYTYHVVQKGYYNLVNKEEGRIYNVITSTPYTFQMRDDIFYL